MTGKRIEQREREGAVNGCGGGNPDGPSLFYCCIVERHPKPEI